MGSSNIQEHHLAKTWILAQVHARDWVGENVMDYLFGVRDRSEDVDQN